VAPGVGGGSFRVQKRPKEPNETHKRDPQNGGWISKGVSVVAKGRYPGGALFYGFITRCMSKLGFLPQTHYFFHVFAFSHVLKVILQNTHVSKFKSVGLHVLKVQTSPDACPQS
jgi:hypothetical protein